jgi:hypothetical protein
MQIHYRRNEPDPKEEAHTNLSGKKCTFACRFYSGQGAKDSPDCGFDPGRGKKTPSGCGI